MSDKPRVTYILKQFLLVHIHKAEGRPLKREESQPLFTKKKKETYKITVLSFFIEFVFLCKRICDISEIQDDGGGLFPLMRSQSQELQG